MSLSDPNGVVVPQANPPSGAAVRPRRASRIATAVLVTGMLVAGAGAMFGLLWTGTAAQIRTVTAERQGVAEMGPLTNLVGELTVARSARARGGQVQIGPIQDAVAEVDVADRRYGTRLSSHSAWSRLHDMLTTLVGRPGGGADGYQEFSDAITLATQLMTDVADTSGLLLDPNVDSYYLVDVLVLRLPQVIVYAGQATDLEASAGGAPLTGENAASLAVARYQVALATSQLVAGIRTSAGANAAVDLSTEQDALQDAVNQLSPPIVVAQLAAPVDAAGLAAAAPRVYDRALALAVAGWHDLDGLLAVRGHALQNRQWLTAVAGAAVVVSTVALLWIAAPTRRRIDQEDDAEPAPPLAPEPALSEARDLLLEELVHVGRGVRTPARESTADAE